MSLASTPFDFNVSIRALALSLFWARASLALAELVSTPSTTRSVSGVPFTMPTPREAMVGRPLSVVTLAAGGGAPGRAGGGGGPPPAALRRGGGQPHGRVGLGRPGGGEAGAGARRPPLRRPGLDREPDLPPRAPGLPRRHRRGSRHRGPP